MKLKQINVYKNTIKYIEDGNVQSDPITGKFYEIGAGLMKVADSKVQDEINWLNDHGYAGLVPRIEELMRSELTQKEGSE
jgi:hypothetical protein